jgi:hypothetical protein
MGAVRFLVIGFVIVLVSYLVWKIVDKYFLNRSSEDEEVETKILEREKQEELLEKKKVLKDMDRQLEETKSKYRIDD